MSCQKRFTILLYSCNKYRICNQTWATLSQSQAAQCGAQGQSGEVLLRAASRPPENTRSWLVFETIADWNIWIWRAPAGERFPWQRLAPPQRWQRNFQHQGFHLAQTQLHPVSLHSLGLICRIWCYVLSLGWRSSWSQLFTSPYHSEDLQYLAQRAWEG